MFDSDGNLFSSMCKSFASGVSSIKGSPLNVEKIPPQIFGSKQNTPFMEIVTKTPIDKRKIFSSFKQTSSSLLRKAQAMKEPIHSNRKLFDNDAQRPTFDPQKYKQENDKENNCQNRKQLKMHSPIPSVKITWNQTISPTPVGKLFKAVSPDIVAKKSPFIVQSQNFKGISCYGTPINGLKGSILAPSTCGSTQANFGNIKNTILLKSNDSKSRNTNIEELSSGNTGFERIGTFKSIGIKSRQQSPLNFKAL